MIKFDIAKTFDTLNWNFIDLVLTIFGFHVIFVQWIRAILTLALLSILFNGSPIIFFF